MAAVTARGAPGGESSETVWPASPDQALAAMMDAYGTMVLRLAHFYVRDRQWAEDVSQEVFVRAYRGWSSFRGASSVKTWLARITVNVCRDELRRRRWRELPSEDLTVVGRGRGLDPEDEVIARLERGRVLGCVLALPAEMREAVFLYYYFGLGTAEIARVLGCPEGTVRSRLHRGRDHLRSVLTEEGWRDGR